MGTSKVILSLGFICFLLNSCGQKDSSNMDLTELRRECDMLRQDRAKALESNVEAQELIDNVFMSLNSISGRMTILERSHENNVYVDNRRKAEEIAKDISTIQEKLLKAEEQDKYDKSTKIIISKLRKTIEQKQQEIDELKDIIQTKDKQISSLDCQVTDLDNKLAQTNQQLRESNVELADTREKLRETEIDSWLTMGDELIMAAETLPNVKGHGNMKPVKAAKLAFVLKAKSCYEKARQLGSPLASSKISNAERLYRQYM